MISMPRMMRLFGLLAVLGLFAPALIACEDQGPAEEMGEAVDETAEETGDTIEDAAD